MILPSDDTFDDEDDGHTRFLTAILIGATYNMRTKSARGFRPESAGKVMTGEKKRRR